MNEPQSVEEESVLRIHDKQLEIHGGMAVVRDPGMLSSALHRPQNHWAYARGSADVATLAAAYATGVERNHPFIDGNKRTAAVACEAFLELSGFVQTASDDEWYDAMIRLASGVFSEQELADWIRTRLAPLLG